MCREYAQLRRMAAQASSKATGKASKSSRSAASQWLLIGGVIAAVLAVLGGVFTKRVSISTWRKPADLQPLHAPKLTSILEANKDYKDTMLWGSYRSGLYFGMRTRSPKGLSSGLMWFDPDSTDTLINQRVRYQAVQGDKLQRYGWTQHDGRTWGQQNILDNAYNLTLTMVKSHDSGSGPGGDWAVRVNVSRAVVTAGTPNPRRISLLMYMTDEHIPTVPWVTLPEGEQENMKQGVQLLSGGSAVTGPWSFHVIDSGPEYKKRPPRLNYLSMSADQQQQDLRLVVKELMLSIVYEQYQKNPMSDRFHMYLPNGAQTSADLALFQVTLPVNGCIDFVFLSHKGKAHSEDVDNRLKALSGSQLTARIQQLQAEFDNRFQRLFPTPTPQPNEIENESSSEAAAAVAATKQVAQAALSNLLGSIGYFYGSSKIKQEGQEQAGQYWPAALFTATPSRSFFPRGFLWDEGFHQLLVSRWDPQVSRDIIAHWLDLMNAKGWIPREQILGEEARQRVPAEFIVQDPKHANPPSLFLPIATMAQKLQSGDDSDGQLSATQEFLRAAWPRLEAWYQWFNTTQTGPEPTSYRWRGRNSTTDSELNPKTLTSGLDDYPRSSHPSPDERHLDLRCWMALASDAMATISTSLGLPQHTTQRYVDTYNTLSDMALLDKLHWDDTRQQYLDWGLHTEAVRLVKKQNVVENKLQEVVVRVVDSPPTLQYVPHFGYVSLFPLLMKLLPPDSPRLGTLLTQLHDENLLWTPYGLRSLSADSSLYRQYNTAHDPPYWRGQIWININYLALVALKHYASLPGPYQDKARQLEKELQQALTQTLVGEYTSRGYLYEQYDDRDGRGTSSHPFTGWTALVALIATGAY